MLTPVTLVTKDNGYALAGLSVLSLVAAFRRVS